MTQWVKISCEVNSEEASSTGKFFFNWLIIYECFNNLHNFSWDESRPQSNVTRFAKTRHNDAFLEIQIFA